MLNHRRQLRRPSRRTHAPRATRSGRRAVFSASGDHERTIGVIGSGFGQLCGPTAIAVDADRIVGLTDSFGYRRTLSGSTRPPTAVASSDPSLAAGGLRRDLPRSGRVATGGCGDEGRLRGRCEAVPLAQGLRSSSRPLASEGVRVDLHPPGDRAEGCCADQGWMCRSQPNGPNAVAPEPLARGSTVSFSHSSGKVLPCTTMRWKFGTS